MAQATLTPQSENGRSERETIPAIGVSPNGANGERSHVAELFIEIATVNENGKRSQVSDLPFEIVTVSDDENQEQGRGLPMKVAHVLMFIVSIPFLALREVYWWLDTDAAVRANGVEVEGVVQTLKTDTHVHTDPESGQTTTTYEHFVTYRYDTPGGSSHTARKKVESHGGLKKDSKIVVYFRQPSGRPVTQDDSALDHRPKLSR